MTGFSGFAHQENPELETTQFANQPDAGEAHAVNL